MHLRAALLYFLEDRCHMVLPSAAAIALIATLHFVRGHESKPHPFPPATLT